MISEGLLVADRYELLSLLGYGGMGEVWEAKDTTLDRLVAVKFVHPHLVASDPSAVKILRDEARLGAQLIGHPNVVLTLDFTEFDYQGKKFHCLVMENVPGVSLQEWITKYGQTIDRETYLNLSLLVAFRTCEAVQFAHRKKLQHRDVKPLNIFLSKYGNIKVGDFGIARFVEELTRTHTVWNAMSPAYAAPEQWRGRKPTKKTDTYQLGCTLFQLFARRLPYDQTSAPALMNAHLNEAIPELKTVEPGVSDKLSKAIGRAMSKAAFKRIRLWQLHDTLANEIMHKYKLSVDVTGEKTAVHKSVSAITQFDLDWIKSEKISYTYEDFDEALSEGIELILNGIEAIRMVKKK